MFSRHAPLRCGRQRFKDKQSQGVLSDLGSGARAANLNTSVRFISDTFSGRNFGAPAAFLARLRDGVKAMADGDGGASGILGVLVGVLLVIFIGAAVLMATGKGLPSNSGPSFTIKLPGAQ